MRGTSPSAKPWKQTDGTWETPYVCLGGSWYSAVRGGGSQARGGLLALLLSGCTVDPQGDVVVTMRPRVEAEPLVGDRSGFESGCIIFTPPPWSSSSHLGLCFLVGDTAAIRVQTRQCRRTAQPSSLSKQNWFDLFILAPTIQGFACSPCRSCPNLGFHVWLTCGPSVILLMQ